MENQIRPNRWWPMVVTWQLHRYRCQIAQHFKFYLFHKSKAYSNQNQWAFISPSGFSLRNALKNSSKIDGNFPRTVHCLSTVVSFDVCFCCVWHLVSSFRTFVLFCQRKLWSLAFHWYNAVKVTSSVLRCTEIRPTKTHKSMNSQVDLSQTLLTTIAFNRFFLIALDFVQLTNYANYLPMKRLTHIYQLLEFNFRANFGPQLPSEFRLLLFIYVQPIPWRE